MKGIDGVELANKIRETDNEVLIIFLNKGRKIIVHTEKKNYEFYGKLKDYLAVW